MKPSVLLLLVTSSGACATAPRVAVAPTPPHGPLARLAFMSGCWRGPDGDGVVEEMIGPADSTLMLSTARYIHGDKVTSFEFLVIQAEANGRAVMTPYLGGKISPAHFVLEPGDGASAVFEDPAFEFPRRVIYRQDGAGLVGRIEGEDPTKGKEWRMQRCAE